MDCVKGICTIVKDDRGVLLGNDFKNLPFIPKRVVFLKFTSGTIRGDHASKETQVIQCLKGSVTLYLKDGNDVTTEEISEGTWIQIPKLIWVILSAKCECSMVAVYSPSEYIESNYIKNFNEYLSYKAKI